MLNPRVSEYKWKPSQTSPRKPSSPTPHQAGYLCCDSITLSNLRFALRLTFPVSLGTLSVDIVKLDSGRQPQKPFIKTYQ